MICSAEGYIALCRLTAEEQKDVLRKRTLVGIHEMLDLHSTSIIQVSSSAFYREDSLGKKIIYYDDLERQIEVSRRLIELMRRTADLIDPFFSLHVMMTYMKLDRYGEKRFALQEAERFGYDRRRFKKDLDAAISEALEKPAMKALLKQVEITARNNGRQEYVDLFDGEESQNPESSVCTRSDTNVAENM